jgi:hypothetical protein
VSSELTEDGEAFDCAALDELSKGNRLIIWSTGLLGPVDVGLYVNCGPEVVVALVDGGVEGDDGAVTLVVVQLDDVEVSESSSSGSSVPECPSSPILPRSGKSSIQAGWNMPAAR